MMDVARRDYLGVLVFLLTTTVVLHHNRVVICDGRGDDNLKGHLREAKINYNDAPINRNLTDKIDRLFKTNFVAQDADLGWDYEPRIWSFEGLESLVAVNSRENVHDDPLIRDHWNLPGVDDEFDREEIDYQPNVFRDHLSLNGSSIANKIQEPIQVEPPTRDPHEEHYFAGSVREHHFGNQSGQIEERLQTNHARPSIAAEDNIKIKDRQQKKECNQFRVDVRETIICDKKRCDKLDFEWPKYDNQVSIIQTTRDGMRFKQIDLAMANSPSGAQIPKFESARHLIEPKTNNRLSRHHQVQDSPKGSAIIHSQRVKIDIFDFLKPKPSSSTTTQAPTSSPSTSAKPEEPTTTTGPKPPDDQDDQDDSTTTTTTPAGSSTTTPSGPNGDDENNRVNKTRFVTTLRLDSRRLKQKMIGFGGALSDATCRNIKSLSPQMADSLMEDYFGARGLRYNLARLSIGSSDFSTTPYTNNDKPNEVGGTGSATGFQKNDDFDDDNNNLLLEQKSRWHQLNRQKWATLGSQKSSNVTNKLQQNQQQGPATDDDLEMKNFRLVSEDLDFKIPIVRQAIATSSQRELKLFASMWSPPIWMKNNSHIVHGYLKGDIYGPYYRALAELMLRWLEAYRQQGIEFWAFTGLNEPVTGIQPFIFHNSLGITKRDYLIFLKLYLGPMLRQRHFEQVKLMLLDDNKGFAPNYVKSALQDPQLASMISGIAYHWYMNDEYENLDFISRDFPSKFLISSEASNGYLPFQVHTLPGDWDRGVAYMVDILAGIRHSSSGWVDWNMVLDLGGGPSWAKNNLDAPIIVNGQRDEYYKSPMFYALGHFSRFVEPESRRLDQILSYARFDYPLDAVAFLTPQNYTVIVALNANRASIPFKVIMNKRLIRQITLRPQSFTTIVFKAPPEVQI